MKSFVSLSTLVALILLSGLGLAADPVDHDDESAADAPSEPAEELQLTLQVPLMSPHFAETPVAVVNDEPITVRDLTDQISMTHAGKEEASTSVGKNYSNLLDRVMTVKLIVQEAKNIGLDELPEIKSQIDRFSSELLIARIMSPQMDAIEADPEELAKLYQKMSRELRMTALTFKNEEEALAFQKEYAARGDFEEVARIYVEAGRADGAVDDEQYMKLRDLRPQIAQVAYEMEPGSVSQIFSAPEGFLIFYLYDSRFYEDESVEAEARKKIREPLMKKRADEYIEGLIEKYSTVDEALLKKVDFEKQKRGFLFSRKEEPVDYQKLLQDERVLATIHDAVESTITVGDLAAKLEERHFHGIEKAAEKGKLNPEKKRVLRDMLFRRVAALEAESQRQDEAPEFLEAVDDFTESLLFNTFINKVVAPDVEISEEEVRAYYDENIDEFSSPVMYRMNGLAFGARDDARGALDKLRRGADFKWVSANSTGQVDKSMKDAAIFDNALLSLTALPEDLHAAVEGKTAGDTLLYSAPGGYHYVISIAHVYPANPSPYATKRAEIAKIIFEAKIKELIRYWSDELRKAYDTRIFITGLDD